MLDRLEVVAQHSGVDWVTFVATEREDPQALWSLGRALLDEEKARGVKLLASDRGGYKGWRSDHVEAVRRADSVLIRMSSDVASAKWTRLAASSGHVTRLDLQTTLRLASSQPSTGPYLLRASRRSLRPGSSRRRLRVTSSNTGSFAGTRGAPLSDYKVTVYDKGVESSSHPPGYRWRIEAQYRRETAQHHWTQLRSAEQPASYCCSAASQSLVAQGGRWPWPPGESLAPMAAPVPTYRSNATRLEYLRKSIVPMLVSLKNQGEGDQLNIILAGLVDPLPCECGRGRSSSNGGV